MVEAEAEGNSKACWEDEGVAAAAAVPEVEARAALPSRARATGISSRDSAESE